VRLDDVRALKLAEADLAKTLPPTAYLESLGLSGSTPAIQQRYAEIAPELGYVPGVALGVAKGKRPADYHLAVQVRTAEEGAAWEAKAPGECDVHIVPEVRPFPTAAHLQTRLRPVVSGAQIQPAGRGWVGTTGFFATDRATGRHVLVSNEHVLTDFGAVPTGTAVVQPHGSLGNEVGTVGRRIPRMAGGEINRVDCAMAWLSGAGDFRSNFTGMRKPGLWALGRQAVKDGRTTGDTFLTVRAVELDGLVVGTDRGLVYFNGQASFMDTDHTDSAAGDSGSAISIDGDLVWLLHAGGPDSRGNDWTYACPAWEACDALGVDPVFAETT